MKTKVNLRLVTGDPNLVTKDEIYVEYNANGTIKSLKKRNDAGEKRNEAGGKRNEAGGKRNDTVGKQDGAGEKRKTNE